jgi:hypothetical protein
VCLQNSKVPGVHCESSRLTCHDVMLLRALFRSFPQKFPFLPLPMHSPCLSSLFPSPDCTVLTPDFQMSPVTLRALSIPIYLCQFPPHDIDPYGACSPGNAVRFHGIELPGPRYLHCWWLHCCRSSLPANLVPGRDSNRCMSTCMYFRSIPISHTAAFQSSSSSSFDQLALPYCWYLGCWFA